MHRIAILALIAAVAVEVGACADRNSTAANEGKHATLAFSGLKRAHREELRNAGRKTLFLFLHSDISTIQQRVDNRAGHFMAPSLVSSQFDSLERPVDETDVVDIDVRAPFNEVLQQAIAIIDQQLLGATQIQHA